MEWNERTCHGINALARLARPDARLRIPPNGTIVVQTTTEGQAEQGGCSRWMCKMDAQDRRKRNAHIRRPRPESRSQGQIMRVGGKITSRTDRR